MSSNNWGHHFHPLRILRLSAYWVATISVLGFVSIGISAAPLISQAALPLRTKLTLSYDRALYQAAIKPDTNVPLARFFGEVSGYPVTIHNIDVRFSGKEDGKTYIGEPTLLIVQRCPRGGTYGYGGGSCQTTTVTDHTLLKVDRQSYVTKFVFPTGFVVSSDQILSFVVQAAVTQPTEAGAMIAVAVPELVGSVASGKLDTTLTKAKSAARPILALNTIFRSVENPAVYYYAGDAKRYVFPDVLTFRSWYANDRDVVRVSATETGAISLGGQVAIRPGTYLVKQATNSRIYAVAGQSVLRPIASPVATERLYGKDWQDRLLVLSDAVFATYTIGEQLTAQSSHVDGTIIQYDRSNDRYVIVGGRKRLLNSAGFRDNNYRTEFITKKVPTTISYPTGSPVTGFEAALFTPAGPLVNP